MEAMLMTQPDWGDTGLRHACSFHKSTPEQIAIAKPFLQQGLALGERCIIFSDDRDTWEAELSALLETGSAQAAISLRATEAYRPPGRLSSLQMTRHLWRFIEEALAHSPACRFLVDMGWTRTEDPAAVCHLEATLDLLYSPDLPVRVLCQFDHAALPPAIVHAALRTHPSVRAGERFLPNLYYEAPAILENEPDLNECSSDAALVYGMLGQFVSMR
jgi:hypothetical protein